MTDCVIPFGMCEIYYDGVQLPLQAQAGEFKAIPQYKELYGGAMNTIQGFVLEDYEVSFTAYLSDQSYQTLMLAIPTLKQNENGLYDNPTSVNMQGKRLVIHPKDVGVSKDFDVCIWSAIIDPRTEFERTYDKNVDAFKVKFIGQPTEKISSFTHFFIGDWEKEGAEYVD